MVKKYFSIASILGLTAMGNAAGFTPGDILASEGGLGSPFNKFFEYTPTGSLVRSVDIPTLPGQDMFDSPKGMVVDRLGNLHIFNGSSTIGVSNYNPVTNVWTTTMLPEDFLIPNASFGKIATVGDNVFLPTHSPGGIIRYNFVTGTHTTFSVADDPIDFSVGSDGLLYALEGSGVPSGDSMQVIDPNSMAVVRSISLSTLAFANDSGSVRDLVVLPDGKFLVSQYTGPAFLLDSNGNRLATYNLQHSSGVQDVDRASSGTFAQFNDNGQVYLFDSNMNYIRNFQSSPDGTSNTFGTFVPNPVPEPLSFSAIVLGLSLLSVRRKRK